jgi:hypothetical protein
MDAEPVKIGAADYPFVAGGRGRGETRRMPLLACCVYDNREQIVNEIQSQQRSGSLKSVFGKIAMPVERFLEKDFWVKKSDQREYQHRS